ncbi:hypothetical protein Mal64_19100 [Pseudobythopirellula maris]|uniref:Uncharacterized protein n=1 Tax=Pseudobythopirellula maris TaxID=2527991 RepID=A0A5C5ZM05_9BACT|nr:hypothetical protein [Pseudobythopirellula maris]TWT88429.1 hypothetical protein Mal64_19100 [Pseudobythopirellula maris]
MSNIKPVTRRLVGRDSFKSLTLALSAAAWYGLFISSAYAATTYRVVGVGVVSQLSHQGVVGERARLSFEYDPLDFRRTSSSDQFTRWEPNGVIEISVWGSSSGDSLTLQPIKDVVLHTTEHLTYFDFSTGIPNYTSGGLLRVDAPNHDSGLNTSVPASFAEAHQTLLTEVDAGGVWEFSEYSWGFGHDYDLDSDDPIVRLDRLSLFDFGWSVLAVPEPCSGWLATGLGLAALASPIRKRPRHGA